MVYRSSISGTALLALFAMSLASVQSSAVAGDKIEFSPAPDALAVPRLERTVTQDPASAFKESLSRHHAEGSDFTTTSGSAVTIIIPVTKSRDHFGWTPPFEQGQDQDADSGLDLFAPRKPAAAHTNSWNVSKDSDTGFSRDRTWNKEGNWMQPNEGISRLGVDTMLRPGEHGEDWLAQRFEKHTTSDWIKGMDTHEPKEYERMRKEGFAPSKEDFSTFYNSPYGSSQQTDLGAAEDLSRSPGASSGLLGKAWPDDNLHSQSDQQVMMQPTMAQAWEDPSIPSHPMRNSSSRDQTFAAPSRAPNAPAILTFPKKPGDLFQ
jgi:hypothetical protein